ncbi:MAG: DUF1801 domain-containing protein [Planctomycetes bacterium]|nr:DUF1801 domain-containing protein [Planctomycetota bacterium]
MPRKTAVRKKPAKKTARKVAKKPVRARSAAQGKVARTLPGAKTGKASAAAPAVGDAPVRAYIASLPAAQRAIARRFDTLIGKTIPGVHRCIKWGMSFYGAGDGWFVSCGGFVDHVKITFLHGTKLKPVPPVGTGKYTRGVDVEHAKDLDEQQVAAWILQASRFPGLGAGRKKGAGRK